MGVMGRIRRLTVSRVEAFLGKVEDPEVLFPQLIREMEDQVRAATEAEAKALASLKGAERGVAVAQDKLAQMAKGAELAVEKGDETTARDALAAQMDLESGVEGKGKALQAAQDAYEGAKVAREQIQKQLADLRGKKDEILTRARVAKTQQEIERTVTGPTTSSGSILDAVAQLETQVEEAEADVSVRRTMGAGGAEPSLTKRLDTLQRDSEIEKRLAALKGKVGEPV